MNLFTEIKEKIDAGMKFEPLQDVPEIKSVHYNETSGQPVYTKAEESRLDASHLPETAGSNADPSGSAV